MSAWSTAVLRLVAVLVGCVPPCQGWLTLTPRTTATRRNGNPASVGKRKAHQSLAAAEPIGGSVGDGRLVSSDGLGDGDGQSRPPQEDPSQGFAPSLVDALDLVGVMRRVAAHAATRRGRDALLSLVTPFEEVAAGGLSAGRRPSSSRRIADRRDRAVGGGRSRERRARSVGGSTILEPRRAASRSDDGTASLGSPLPPAYRARRARSRDEAVDEYRRVEQAMQVFRAGRQWRDGGYGSATAATNESSRSLLSQLSCPRLYGNDEMGDGMLGPWSDDVVVESDDDEWLHFRDLDDFDLEHVAQAEQVMKLLWTVHEWADSGPVQAWAPILSEIGRRSIRPEPLKRALRAIRHGVEIVRVRSIVDPLARSTYRFQLNATTFPVIGRLRETLKELEERRYSEAKSRRTTLDATMDELRQQERDILRDLVRSVVQSRDAVQAGLNAVAEMDVLFAKAAFGIATRGRIPVVARNSSIDAKQFVHPLLAQEDAVPVDLRLSRNGTRALVVTGMNGGGKTLALKSFGVAACLVRLGIPIPVEAARLPPDYAPVVTFFDDIAAAIGDRQDVANGESTFTSSLNAYSAMIDRSSTHPDRSCLFLLDELGSGTEPESGGAIGQAILERLLQSELCRVVVTTHSPRLKALAFDSEEIDCASVLQARRDGDPSSGSGAGSVPTFQLQYGAIGESDAVGAATRADPPLPLEVIDRASALLLDAKEIGTEKSKYVRALSESLEGQIRRAEASARDVEREASRARQCRIAMLTMARSYELQLSRLENRVEACYQLLRTSSDDPLAITGETLEELRVIRKQIKSEAEMLREQGLKVVPDWYTLTNGESVVVVSDGEWNGLTGRVLLRDGDASTGLAKDEVEVLLSNATVAPRTSIVDDDPRSQLTLVFKRQDLAIWDYDSVWDGAYEGNEYAFDTRATSLQDSRRRLADILTSLKSATLAPSRESGSTLTSSFKSSRARKAAKSKTKAKKPSR